MNKALAKRVNSFRYAGKGMLLFIRTQVNAWIHLSAAAAALTMGALLHITRVEFVLIILCIAMVLAAEACNTAIEFLVDLVSPEYNVQAGKVKDLAAGAVLVTAIGAAVAGGIIFWPYLAELVG